MTKPYTIHHLESGSGAFRAEVRFDASHPVFAGHFPGQPVVPGVFLVEILSAVVSEIAGRQLILRESSGIKFLQVIDPRQHPEVQISGTIVETDAENFRVDATIRQGELLFAKMKGMILK